MPAAGAGVGVDVQGAQLVEGRYDRTVSVSPTRGLAVARDGLVRELKKMRIENIALWARGGSVGAHRGGRFLIR